MDSAVAQALVLEGAPALAEALVKEPPPGWRSLARGGSTRTRRRGSATAAAASSAVVERGTLLGRLTIRTTLRLNAGARRLRGSAKAEAGLHVETTAARTRVALPLARGSLVVRGWSRGTLRNGASHGAVQLVLDLHGARERLLVLDGHVGLARRQRFDGLVGADLQTDELVEPVREDAVVHVDASVAALVEKLEVAAEAEVVDKAATLARTASGLPPVITAGGLEEPLAVLVVDQQIGIVGFRLRDSARVLIVAV